MKAKCTNVPAAALRVWLSVQALILAAFLYTPAVVSAAWPVHQFEVFPGEPGLRGNPGLEWLGEGLRGSGLDPDSAADGNNANNAFLIQEIEYYLYEVALELEKLGFSAPRLEPVVTRADGQRAYRVYLYDYQDSTATAPARYGPSCGNAEPYIIIDLLRASGDTAGAVVNGKVTAKGYVDIAHELFHAVQADYPLFKEGCKNGLGDWVTEGTAQAIGMYMAKKLRGVKSGSTVVEWGMRPYNVHLWVEDDPASKRMKDASYQTSSFWRYLAEFRGGKQLPVASVPASLDYRYLHEFFSKAITGKGTEDSELKWLDERLTENFQAGLDRIYPAFATTFAAYGKHRIVPKQGSRAAAIRKWLDFNYNACKQVNFQPVVRTARQGFKLDKVAAVCFRVNFPVNLPADITIYARGQDKDLLRAIKIGTDDGKVVSPPFIYENPGSQQGGFIGYWNFRVDLSRQPIFIVSNVASDVARTQKLMPVDLEFRIGGWESNLTTPRNPAAKGKQAAKSARQPATNSGEGEQNAVALEGPQTASALTEAGASAYRDDFEDVCTEYFVYSPCSPKMEIMLTLMSGGGVTSLTTKTSGGEAAQRMSLFGSVEVDENGVPTMAALKQIAGRIDYRYGDQVTIEAPLFDYGFTGTLKALITVPVPSEDTRSHEKSLETVGPADNWPGTGARFPISGSLSVEEYSPTIMRGSFSGRLVDPEPPRDGSWSDDPVLPVVDTISGRFVIATPMRGDDRAKLQQDISREEAIEDLGLVFPNIPDFMLDAARQGENIPAGPPPNAPPTDEELGMIKSFTGCDCSCAAQNTADPQCQVVCSESYAYCGEGQDGATNDAERISALREKFLSKMAEKYPSKTSQLIVATFAPSFDEAASYRQKELLYRVLVGEAP